MGIRADRYKAMVPQVVGELRLKGRVHATEARLARAHTQAQAQDHHAGADDDHRHDRGPPLRRPRQDGDGVRRRCSTRRRARCEADGVDVIQFDEPAFNVYMDEVRGWGIEALHAATEGVTCTTAVHICYGYGIKANVDWKATLGGEWRQYEKIFPALAQSRIGQVSLECRNSQGADGAAEAARRQGRAGRRDRRRDRRGRNAGGGRGRDRRGDEIRAEGAGSSRAPIAAWRRCGATSRRQSSTRSAPAPGWRGSGSHDQTAAAIIRQQRHGCRRSPLALLPRGARAAARAGAPLRRERDQAARR